MSVDDHDAADPPGTERPFAPDELPRLRRAQERLEHCLRRFDPRELLSKIPGLSQSTDSIGPAEVLWRPSGVNRSGVVVQCVWQRFSIRLAFGLDTPLAHQIVDRLLGGERPIADHRLPISPVEWGILTYLAADLLGKLRAEDGTLGPWDLLIDRVSPDPFDSDGLGRIVTIRWPVRIGTEESSLRLWLPESLVGRWLAEQPVSAVPEPVPADSESRAALESEWRAEACRIPFPRGLKSLRVRGLIPLVGDYRRGTPASPEGVVQLIHRTTDSTLQSFFLAEPVPDSGGGRLTLMSVLQKRRALGDPNKTSQANAPSEPTGTSQMDGPVTLTVELGRVNLTVAKLADLKPGDVIELQRHSREPIELTSGGKTVARGELVQLDDELGVRVTHVLI